MRLDHASYVPSHYPLANAIQSLGDRLDSTFVDGCRRKQGGKCLTWEQIEVLGTFEDKQHQFFIEWFPLDLPLSDGKAITKTVNAKITGNESSIEEWHGTDVFTTIGSNVEVQWVAESANNKDSRIVTLYVMTPSDVARLG
jgi:hypothetical protein